MKGGILLATARKPCAYCKEIFNALGNTRYCSAVCKALAKAEREENKERTCKWCGNIYRNRKDIFCSAECFKAYKKAHCKPEPPKILKPKESLAEVNQKARELGLSYGQLEGLRYARKYVTIKDKER